MIARKFVAAHTSVSAISMTCFVLAYGDVGASGESSVTSYVGEVPYNDADDENTTRGDERRGALGRVLRYHWEHADEPAPRRAALKQQPSAAAPRARGAFVFQEPTNRGRREEQ